MSDVAGLMTRLENDNETFTAVEVRQLLEHRRNQMVADAAKEARTMLSMIRNDNPLVVNYEQTQEERA